MAASSPIYTHSSIYTLVNLTSVKRHVLTSSVVRKPLGCIVMISLSSKLHIVKLTLMNAVQPQPMINVRRPCFDIFQARVSVE